MSLPAYRPPISVVTCMRAVETNTPTQAIHRDSFRPTHLAVNPAEEDETKAPRTIKLAMSCCLSEGMLYPSAVDGSFTPKTLCRGISKTRRSFAYRSLLTCKKGTIAYDCRIAVLVKNKSRESLGRHETHLERTNDTKIKPILESG